MADRYTTYASYPGRQHYVMVVPRAFGQLFFEGIQSMDAASNVNETTHGQYGFKSDVLISKTYTNTSGSVALKDFNNMSFVLRAMTGVEPNASFIFDPSLLEPVDVFVNIYNDERTRVMRSCWYVDFTPTVTQNNTLDEIETGTIAYTSVRKIDFEGKQIVCQTFTNTKAGDFEFTLMWKAVIDPTVQTSEKNPNNVTTGIGRHDLCPFQYLLRVWVGDQVLDDPEAAQVTTVQGATDLQSTVHLKTPLAQDGTIVKVMWLAEGTDPIAQEGVTSAPVMVAAKPQITDAGTPTAVFDGIMQVFFSKTLSADSLAALSASDFVLTFGDGTNEWEQNPMSITYLNLSVTDNIIELDFEAAPTDPVGGGSWSTGQVATLCYEGTVLQDTEGFTTPPHCIELQPF